MAFDGRNVAVRRFSIELEDGTTYEATAGVVTLVSAYGSIVDLHLRLADVVMGYEPPGKQERKTAV